MYTQCPECLTIYEIDEDALQASLGIVRCGRCDKRFDALRTLSNTLPVEPLTPLPELDLSEHAPILTEAVPASAFERAAKKARSKSTSAKPASVEVEPAASPPMTSNAQDDPSADEWFSGIESELATTAVPPQGLPFDTGQEDASPVELPNETGSLEATRDAATMPTAEDDIDEILAAETGAASNAFALVSVNETTPMESAPAVLDSDAVMPLDLAPFHDDPELADKWHETPQRFTTLENETDGLDGTISDEIAWTEIAPFDDEPNDRPPAEPVYVRPPVRRFSRAGATWVLGCCLLTLVLVAQLVWASRAELFKNPATHAWMARVCSSISCRLPLIQDTAKLQLLSRDVRPDPYAAGALTITATIRNNAAFSQPWPVVVVELTDLNNDPVAMRRFRPVEYLPDAGRRAAGIASGATAAVAFEVADPGKQAVAFQFGFE